MTARCGTGYDEDIGTGLAPKLGMFVTCIVCCVYRLYGTAMQIMPCISILVILQSVLVHGHILAFVGIFQRLV
jgi:hypothetical protein